MEQLFKFYLSMDLQYFRWTLAAFSVTEPYTQSVGSLGRGISPPKGRYLHTEQHKHNKRTQKSVPRAGFQPTIRGFHQAKRVDVLDRAATVIDV
jgi:hypothetical protein